MNPPVFDARSFIKHLTSRPGVYQMLGGNEVVLYVGKAKNLKKRVSSYFLKNITPKTKALMSQVVDIRVIVTASEMEALILENNLIKTYRPRYNILFRDDKSYPYIYASTQAKFPRLDFYRGAKKLPGKYFGPYPGGQAVHETLNLLQKIFLLRSCQDSFFNHRTRPCLQYQIKRCSAPCVNYISQEDYQQDFSHALDFLEGKDETVLRDLEQRMQEAATKLDYETAAKYRDQISKIREVQAKQYAIKGQNNMDIIAISNESNAICICLLMVRKGAVLGNRTFFPKLQYDETHTDVIEQFITQHYLSESSNLPDYIVTSEKLPNESLLKAALTQELHHVISFKSSLRDETKKWFDMAKRSAAQALTTHLTNQATIANKFDDLNNALKLSIARIECFDISHTSGESCVASCVVFDLQGAKKSDYRHFNIEDIQAGDDYAAMRQALYRRYSRLKKDEAKLPDLLLIDGGKGQLSQAQAVLEELQISGVAMLGIAKGPSRKAGLETLFLAGRKNLIVLAPDSKALHLLQQIRDEAHRFAITHNRQKTASARTHSRLEDVEGIGPKRRQALLKYFGGLPNVIQASVDQLAKVPGINQSLAEKIYDMLHEV